MQLKQESSSKKRRKESEVPIFTGPVAVAPMASDVKLEDDSLTQQSDFVNFNRYVSQRVFPFEQTLVGPTQDTNTAVNLQVVQSKLKR